MHIKSIVGIVGSLILAVVFLVLWLGTMATNSDLEEENQELENGISALEEEKSNVGLSQGETDTVQFVEGIFDHLYNYDNDTFNKRFEDLEGRVNEDEINKIRGSGESVEPPEVQISSNLENIQIYRELTTENGIGALVEVDSSYQVGDNPISENTYMYRVVVEQINGNLYMTQVTALGAINPVDQP